MFGKKEEEQYTTYELHDFVYGIVSAIANAKSEVDLTAIQQREKFLPKHDLMKLMPLTTFKLEEIEVNLKYNIEPLPKGEEPRTEDGTPKVMISPYSEKLKDKPGSTQSITFKLRPQVIKDYLVAGETKTRIEDA